MFVVTSKRLVLTDRVRDVVFGLFTERYRIRATTHYVYFSRPISTQSFFFLKTNPRRYRNNQNTTHVSIVYLFYFINIIYNLSGGNNEYIRGIQTIDTQTKPVLSLQI